jgi:DNA-binding response OmpR family regulator
LDENMPGMSGLETLWNEREKSAVPMIMITKSEEYIMEEAIGSKIKIT